ncbi:alpha/beta hydrolase family protein [Clostridium tunisiense]|uniref:alpha/beta hydrolase family protein n=1 Tax=Clostridium tunisiense TaxID=219748 RepID=UPI0002F59277|nr:dienelactone hydrolase family protein [Clostridium tunisiense]
MLTILEILIILLNIPVLIWPLLPIKKVPRFLDFMPLAAVIAMVLHLFIDQEAVTARFVPLYIFTITLFLITIIRIFKHNPNQPKRRVLAVIGRIFQIGLLVICVLIPTVIIPFYSLPEPTGTFDVGTVVMDFTDNNRIETLSKKEGENRKVAVQFWYPSDRQGAEAKYDINNATISTTKEEYPLIIFSHGAFGMRMSNASTCRELASHGYIVASIDHAYQAFYTSFADGKVAIVNQDFLNEAIGVQVDDITGQKAFNITHNWLNLRTADIDLVINSLKAGNLGTSGEVLKGHMDLENIGLLGHSLGGAASAEVAREREDVKAAIVIDGTMIGDITGLNSENGEIITEEKFNKPLMLMYGSLFLDEKAKETSYLPNIKAYNNANSSAYSLCIKDSGHLNFTDLPRISPFLAKKLGVGNIDSFQCIKIVNDYTLAFFDKHIKGEGNSLLEGNKPSEQVEFSKRIAGN